MLAVLQRKRSRNRIWRSSGTSGLAGPELGSVISCDFPDEPRFAIDLKMAIGMCVMPTVGQQCGQLFDNPWLQRRRVTHQRDQRTRL